MTTANGVAKLATRGSLIVLEGLDRSGKTTQAKMLLDYFLSNGQNARIQRFPDRSEENTGQIIDSFLKNSKEVNESREAINLIFAANRWLLAPKILNDLDNGVHVILDRYSFSGVAYSMAKGLDKHWVCMPEIGLPMPDLVLFLDIDQEKTSQRLGFGDEVMERTDFQQLVYANMNKLFDPRYWRRIDAAGEKTKVNSQIIEEVGKVLAKLTNSLPAKFALHDWKLTT